MKSMTKFVLALTFVASTTAVAAPGGKTILSCDNVQEPETGYIFEVFQHGQNLVGKVQVISDGDLGQVFVDPVTYQKANSGAAAKGRFISNRGNFAFVFYGKKGYLTLKGDRPQVLSCLTK